MCDVLFVVPTVKPSISNECGGTLLLASILKQEGVDVEIFRYLEADMTKGYDIFIDQAVSNILTHNPKIVSFYCRCDCFLSNIQIARKLKALRSDLIVIFGGPQAEALCIKILEELPWIDYCCSGEGETTVYPLFYSLLNGKDISSIKGLTYRNSNGTVISNPNPDFIKNLDDTPLTDYKLIPAEFLQQDIAQGTYFPIEVGRGCPYNCVYCSTSLFWKRKFRLKSADRIVKEISYINEKYGINRFIFNHDLFTASKKHVLEFCNKLSDSEINASWVCSSRIDTVDEEMIDAMVNAGMCEIYLGVETGSERMQKIIKKNLNIDNIVHVVKNLLNRNVKVTTSFMYGFPEETEDDIEQTLQLVNKLFKMGVDIFQFHLCAIFPGTEYFDKYKNELVFAENQSDQVNDFGVVENYTFICEHKELFPFYYEYKSPLRARFAKLETYILICLDIYNNMLHIDNDKFKNLRLIDVFLSFKDANIELIDKYQKHSEAKENELTLITNYLSTIYTGEELDKLINIFTFRHDCWYLCKRKDTQMEVKLYSVDIASVNNNKCLNEIGTTPTMVYFNKINNKLNMIIKPQPNK